jgi:glycosyltransferase involved in cell wall biosynthesis
MSNQTSSNKRLRVAFHWGGLSGYMAACWRALAARTEFDFRLVVPGPHAEAPFDPRLLEGFDSFLMTKDNLFNFQVTLDEILRNDPEVVVLTGWSGLGFSKQVAADKRMTGRAIIMTADTPFSGTARQYAGRFVMRRYFQRLDLVVGAGDRTVTLCKVLGIPEANIRTGNYGYDDAAFGKALEMRPQEWPRRFAFIGRYVSAHKGIDLLVEGYRAYRSRVQRPWELVTCGAGPDAGVLKNVQGLVDRGFVQPADQPKLLSECGAFILPSRYEPWGVAIVEAGGAGLPLLTSSRCSAAADVIRPYYNGIVFAPESAQAITDAMLHVHELHERDPQALRQWGLRSRELSVPFGAEFWAARWSQYIHQAHAIRASKK